MVFLVATLVLAVPVVTFMVLRRGTVQSVEGRRGSTGKCLHYFFQGGSYQECPYFVGKSVEAVQARVHVHSLYLIV